MIIECDNYATVELPYTTEQLRELPEQKLQKIMEKGIYKLRQLGIARAILTNTMKAIFSPNISAGNFRIIDGKLLFFDFVPKMVQWICENYELEPPNIKISIREERLSRISQSLIENLCYHSKYMNLATADTVAARQFAKVLLDEFGFMLDIRNIAEIEGNNFSDIIVDVDNLYVTAPQRCIIDGLVIDDIKHPEDTDLFDYLVCLGLRTNDVYVNKWKSIDITN